MAQYRTIQKAPLRLLDESKPPSTDLKRPIVDAVINGKIKARMMVDTGAGGGSLLAPFVRKVGLKVERVPDSGTEFVEFSSLTFGEVEGQGGMTVTPKRYDTDFWYERIDGVIGADMLENYAVVFDLKTRQLLLYSEGKLTEDEIKTLGFADLPPVPIRRVFPDMPLVCLEVQLERRQKVDLILDTGSVAVVVPDSLQAVKGKKVLREGEAQVGGIAPVAEASKRVRLIELTVQVGRSTRSGVTTGLVDERLLQAKGRSVGGVLGMSFLSLHNFCVDYATQKLYLRPL